MPYFHMKVKQGSDYEVSFTANDPDSDLPINLSVGYTLVGKVGKRHLSDTHLYEWSQQLGNIVGENGRFVVRVPGTDSAIWDFGRVFYDIKVVNDSSGAEVISAYGPLTVFPSLV